VRAGLAQVLSPVTPGEGVLATAGDIAAGTTLLRAGTRITPAHAAVMMAAGIDLLSVRIPFLRIVRARPVADASIDAIVMHVEAVTSHNGCVVKPASGPLADMLRADGDDALVVVGGTGSGADDDAVRTLAAAGEVKVHGIALNPGETAAFGLANGRPVLALPGRLDAALAVWHLVGRPLLARLSGCIEALPTRAATLTHKIASTVGVSELVPVRCDGVRATPIASGYVPLAGLARSDGWVLVRPESEGYPAGSEVVVRPFP
jgi:molybdopterin biosynthesis enzyme